MTPLKKMLNILPLVIITLFLTSTFATQPLSVFRQKIKESHASVNTNKNSSTYKDLQVLYYHQTLDHFNYQPQSYTKFKQKYMLYSKYWGGAKDNAPIFAYLGDEAPLPNHTLKSLILTNYAQKFNALLLLMEHRFYGESKPYGMSMEEIIKNASVRGYFNSAQALADYAEIITHVRKRLHAHHSPVIVVGGSYGGMLASWFRLKYPHIALGALAASAPVLYFDNMIKPDHGYYSVVSNDFKEASESCYETIKRSWDKIEKIGSSPSGLSYLSKKFNTCVPLNDTSDLENFLEDIYEIVAQYGNLEMNSSTICNAIDKGRKGKDILRRLYAGALAYFYGAVKCLDISSFDQPDETSVGYAWQTCSEMVMPAVTGTSGKSMFPPQTFDLRQFSLDCKNQYNVMPRPHWITTYYGGHDMKLILERFGSNIIFSNGLKDPYSSAGVLQDLSESVIAVYTEQGSHCVDILAAQDDDPEWLINQRKTEVHIISGWLKQYQQDLLNYLK